MKSISLQTRAKLAMLAATLIWGSSFVIVEDLVNTLPTNAILAIRFISGAILLSLVFMRQMKCISKAYLIRGSVLGTLLFLAYMTQTLGISMPDNTPGKNAFLTAVYVVIVPFFAWIFIKKRPTVYNIVSAFLCIIGIGFVSLTEAFTLGIGDGLTLIGGIFYALHIIAMTNFSDGRDPIVLTVIQFATSGILALILSLCTEMPQILAFTPTVSAILQIAYLAIFCTAIALTCQAFGQKYTDPSTSSMILSLESVFGVVFSLIVGAEVLTVRTAIGFAVIFAAVIISETKLSFLRIPRKK